MDRVRNMRERPDLELRKTVSLLRLRKWVILAIILLAGAAAVLLSLRQTPLYQAEAKVLVKPVDLSSGTAATEAKPNLDTEEELARSIAVAALAQQELDARESPTKLLENVTVDTEIDTEVLVFEYVHAVPDTAQQRAQAFADAYIEYRRRQTLEDLLAQARTVEEELQILQDRLDSINRRISNTSSDTTRASLLSQANLLSSLIVQQQLNISSLPDDPNVGEVVQPAVRPKEPVSPNHVANGILGLLLGAALSLGYIFFRDRIDDRIKAPEDLEVVAGTPVLGTIPEVAAWRRTKRALLVTRSDPNSAAAEAFRSLRTVLIAVASVRGAKTILVTSANPSEGKTSTTANLGVVLAQAGMRVVLVGADLRKPRLHEFFDLTGGPGLVPALRGEVGIGKAMALTSLKNLRVVANERSVSNSSELLGSSSMRRIIDELRQTADFILIDSPPVLTVADAPAVAPLVDGVLLVAAAGATSPTAISRACKQLERANASMLGAVLNDFDAAVDRTYYQTTYGAPAEEAPLHPVPQETRRTAN